MIWPRRTGKTERASSLFLSEAVKYHVLPLDDRTLERLNAASGRPTRSDGWTDNSDVFEGMIGMSENTFINAKNRSHTITAEVENGTNGATSGSSRPFRRLSLYLKDGKPTYTYNWPGLKEHTVAATQALPSRESHHPLRVRL